MRVLICGSRNWHDAQPIREVLEDLAERNETLVVIHGDAPGADRLAKRLAIEQGAEVIDEPADWEKYGKAAGPIRNQKMLDDHDPDEIWAFRCSGKSNGTDDMVRRGRAANIPTHVVNGE